MPQHRKTNSVVALLAVGLLLLLLFGVYMASYYTCLANSIDLTIQPTFYPDGHSDFETRPRYRISGVSGLFWPAHQLDRRLRPQHWSKEQAFRLID